MFECNLLLLLIAYTSEVQNLRSQRSDGRFGGAPRGYPGPPRIILSGTRCRQSRQRVPENRDLGAASPSQTPPPR